MHPDRREKLRRQFVGRTSFLVPFLEDSRVTDILINGTEGFYLEIEGVLERRDLALQRGDLVELIERLVVPIGKRIDATHPYLDGRLLEGSRFHIVLPPIAPEGPLISIRRWRDGRQCTLSDFGNSSLINFLLGQVTSRRNFLISGGTGSGKTTLLSRLLDSIEEEERIAIIEETMEIQIAHRHQVRLEARTASPDGVGEVSLQVLVRNALRMRPDRLIVGECRGAEAFDMISAMNTGHLGSFTTLHANNAREALKRLESLILLAGVPLGVARQWVASNIHLVVHLTKEGALRQIAELILVEGLEGDVYRIHPLTI